MKIIVKYSNEQLIQIFKIVTNPLASKWEQVKHQFDNEFKQFYDKWFDNPEKIFVYYLIKKGNNMHRYEFVNMCQNCITDENSKNI